jgi:hypothetical protein
LDRAWHERPTPTSDFFAAAVEEDTLGDVETFRTANDLATGEEMAFGDWPQEIKLERGSYNEQIPDERLHSEKGCVVKGFEINGSVNRSGRVIEVLTHGHFNLGAAFLRDAKLRPEPFVDGCTVIHCDERFKVCAFHVVVSGSLRD